MLCKSDSKIHLLRHYRHYIVVQCYTGHNFGKEYVISRKKDETLFSANFKEKLSTQFGCIFL